MIRVLLTVDERVFEPRMRRHRIGRGVSPGRGTERMIVRMTPVPEPPNGATPWLRRAGTRTRRLHAGLYDAAAAAAEPPSEEHRFRSPPARNEFIDASRAESHRSTPTFYRPRARLG